MLKASIHVCNKGNIASKPFLCILFTTLVIWHDYYLINFVFALFCVHARLSISMHW